MLGFQEDCRGMVELDSNCSVDWSDSMANHDKAEPVKSNSPKAGLLPCIFAYLENSRYLSLRLNNHLSNWRSGIRGGRSE